MINNVIFDLGNVLVNFKPLDYVRNRISDGEKAEKIYQSIFKSPEWLMLDRGVVTEKEAIDTICKRHSDLSQGIRLVMTDWYQMLTPIDNVIDILKELRSKGYKTYFLSNYQLLAYEYVLREYDIFSHFDGGIFSFKERLLKPETEIYKKLVETYKEVDPGESIFIDDTEENVEAAAGQGFKAILFKNVPELRGDLAKYGVQAAERHGRAGTRGK